MLRPGLLIHKNKAYGLALPGHRPSIRLATLLIRSDPKGTLRTAGDEMTPSIEVARKMAQLLDTTMGYLLCEVEEGDTFKDPTMLLRLKEGYQSPGRRRKKVCFI